MFFSLGAVVLIAAFFVGKFSDSPLPRGTPVSNEMSSQEIEGTFEIIIEEDLEPLSHPKLYFRLTAGKDSYGLRFSDQAPNIPSGTRIKVSGTVRGGVIEVASLTPVQFTPLTKGTTLLPESIGNQRTLVILTNFLDDTRRPYTRRSAENVLRNEVDPYFRDASYGKTWITGRAVGWITLDMDSTCDDEVIRKATIDAVDDSVDFTQYDRLIIAYPTARGRCRSHATLGKIETQTEDGIVRLGRVTYIGLRFGSGTVAHELGHSLGLVHANGWDCRPEIMGTVCSSDEYGDPYDAMGNGGLSHFNAFSKEKLGWFAEDEIVIAASGLRRGKGTYTLEAFESPTSRVKALKVRGYDSYRKVPVWYYIEYRRPIGQDARLFPNTRLEHGVLLHISGLDVERPFSASLLLDMDPTNWPPFSYEALKVGKSFVDPITKIEIFVARVLTSEIVIKVRCSDAAADSDKDGLSDCEEADVGTDPLTSDTDKDGCRDGAELGKNPKEGGLRDPTNPYDFFDVNHDGKVAVTDILLVARAYRDSSGQEYHPSKDRGPLVPGASYSWERTGPDGKVTTDDVFAAASQYGHSCNHDHSNYSGPDGTPFGPHP